MAILLVVDGLGDRPIDELGGRTPLEAAETPNLDSLAEEGCTGLVDVVRPGVPPGSDTAHLALFGFDPYDDYTGRGAFEALGAGLEVGEGDVAFRGNFATVEEGRVVDRRAGREVEEGDELAALLDGVSPPGFPGIEVRVAHTTQHRCAVVMKGPGLSRSVSDTDPHEEGAEMLEARAEEDSEEAERTAEALNALSGSFHEILDGSGINDDRVERGLPRANHLLLRGAGVVPQVPGFEERFGVEGRYVAPVALYGGAAEAVGLEALETPEGITSMDDLSQVEAEVEAAGKGEFDFLFFHVKGADNASHDGRFRDKVEVVEKVDWAVGELRELHGGPIAVTGDHSTPCVEGAHSGDPVPLLLSGPGTRPDSTGEFGERSCMEGGIGRIRGRDVIYELMNLEGRVPLHGE